MALGADHYTWMAHVCDSCGRVPDVTDTASIATLAPAVNTTYNVTATNIAGCTTSGQFHISVVPLPAMVPQDTIRMCINSSTQISAIQADSVRWSPAAYLSDPTAISPVCTATASIVYTVTAYNSLGCSITQQVPVKVTDKIITKLSADTTVCPGSAVQIRVSP